MAAKLEVQATLAAMPPGGRKRAQRKAVHEFLEEARASATVLEFLDSEWCSSQVKEVASQLAERVATGVSPPEAAAYRYSDPKHIIATLRTEIHFAGVYQPAVPLRDIAGLVLRRAARQRVCFHKGAASHSFRDATRPIIGFAEYSKEHLALRHEAYPYKPVFSDDLSEFTHLTLLEARLSSGDDHVSSPCGHAPGTLMGYALLSNTYVYDLAVHPSFFGLGVGASLIRALVVAAPGGEDDDATDVEKDDSEVSLDVRFHNPAKTLYTRLGFVSSGRSWGFYDWHGGLEMSARRSQLIQQFERARQFVLWTPQARARVSGVLSGAAKDSEEETKSSEAACAPAAPTAATGAFLWTHEQAAAHETLQIGASACGATAIVNALHALGVPVSIPDAAAATPTRLRKYDVPLGTYLAARSVAGVDHTDFQRALPKVAPTVRFRFFPTTTALQRRVDVMSILRRWIQWGGAPIVTLNPQVVASLVPARAVPDAWHHQMVYGVDSDGRCAHATNGENHLPRVWLHAQLCSPSVLLIHRDDVLRWLEPPFDKEDLKGALAAADTSTRGRWTELRVVEQVAAVTAQHEAGVAPDDESPCVLPPCAPHVPHVRSIRGHGHKIGDERVITHIVIPACYSTGFTVVAPPGCRAYEELLTAPDLLSEAGKGIHAVPPPGKTATADRK